MSTWPFADAVYDRVRARLRADAERLEGDLALAMFLQGDGYLDRLHIVAMPAHMGIPDTVASKWGDW